MVIYNKIDHRYEYIVNSPALLAFFVYDTEPYRSEVVVYLLSVLIVKNPSVLVIEM